MDHLYLEYSKKEDNDKISNEFQNFIYDLENVYKENPQFIEESKLYDKFEGYSFYTKIGLITGNLYNFLNEFKVLEESFFDYDNEKDNLLFFNNEIGNNWWKLRKTKCCQYLDCNLVIYNDNSFYELQKYDTISIYINDINNLEGLDLIFYKKIYLHESLIYNFFAVYSSVIFKRIFIVNPETMELKDQFDKIKSNFIWLVSQNINNILDDRFYKKILPVQENLLEIIHFKFKTE